MIKHLFTEAIKLIGTLCTIALWAAAAGCGLVLGIRLTLLVINHAA